MAKKPTKKTPAKKKATPRPRGRPTKYTRPLARKILMGLLEGKSLREICRDPKLPDESTVRLWAFEDRDGFSTQYARARDLGLEAEVDYIIEIADDGRNDFVERARQDGSTYQAVDHEHIQRSKLRVDTRKWKLSKIAPKKYGDRVALDHGGQVDNPTNIEVKVKWV